MDKIDTKILEIAQYGPIKAKRICKLVPVSRGTIYNHINKLLQLGLIKRLKRGVYECSKEGVRQLDCIPSTFIIRISEEIRQIFTRMDERNKATDVLLLGAGRVSKGESLRESLRKKLEEEYITGLDIQYPEDWFQDFAYGLEKIDLLHLENHLAESMDVIVILLEGIGALVEFGLFANHHKLRNKLVVVFNNKFKRKRSFIRLGPIRFLEKRTKSIIIYHDFYEHKVESLRNKVIKAIKKKN